MIPENRTWDGIKKEYLRKVEKALSSVNDPRKREVLEDVRVSHHQELDRLECPVERVGYVRMVV